MNCVNKPRRSLNGRGASGDRAVAMQRYWGTHDIDEVTEDGVVFVGLAIVESESKGQHLVGRPWSAIGSRRV